MRTAEVRNPYLASRAEVVDYLMLRNTLLLVREHFGRYKAFIRCCIALVAPGRRRRPSPPRAVDLPAAGAAEALRDYALGRFGPPPADLRG